MRKLIFEPQPLVGSFDRLHEHPPDNLMPPCLFYRKFCLVYENRCSQEQKKPHGGRIGPFLNILLVITEIPWYIIIWVLVSLPVYLNAIIIYLVTPNYISRNI